MTYQERMRSIAPAYDPRHIEAYMRLQYGVLDHLSPHRFAAEVALSCACIDEDKDAAERLARSYGL